MPDLRSELMKLDNLQFDDDVTESPITDETKTNFSKSMWEAIKNNPNSNSQQIADVINNGSLVGIATRLKQMLDRGLLSRTKSTVGFRYQAVGDSYPAFNRSEALAKAHAVKQINKAKRIKQKEYNAKYNAKKKENTTAALPIPPTSLTKNPNAEQLVNSMSVGMAKAVYLELKRVFEA